MICDTCGIQIQNSKSTIQNYEINPFQLVRDTLTAVMICISLRSTWRNRGSSLKVAEHQALLKFRRPLLALAFTGSEVDEADIWASKTSSFSIPRGGNSSELRKKQAFIILKELSRICSSHYSHKQNLLALLLTIFRTCACFVGMLTILPKEKGCNHCYYHG